MAHMGVLPWLSRAALTWAMAVWVLPLVWSKSPLLLIGGAADADLGGIVGDSRK